MVSEYGRGYATCLRQFSNHRIRLVEFVALYARLAKENPKNADIHTPEQAAGLWMSSASDHLRDLIKPKRKIGNATWKQAKWVRDTALGLRLNINASPEECEKLLDAADVLLWLTQTETLDEALAWDEANGLKPDKGSWSCSLDIVVGHATQ